MRFRLDALAYAVALSFTGLAVAATVVVRAICDAIDAATSLPGEPVECPDTVPDEWNLDAL